MIPAPHTILIALLAKFLLPAILGLFGFGSEGERGTLESLIDALPLRDGVVWESPSLSPLTSEPVRVQPRGREPVGSGESATEAYRLQIDSHDGCRIIWIAVLPPHPLLRLDPLAPGACDPRPESGSPRRGGPG